MPDPTPRDDHDSPWKEALEHYFPEFLQFLFPHIHTEIDWTQGHEFLDKELQQIVRDAELGRRYADKLVKVHTADGSETWVLVHVEVQGDPEPAFAERMYVYNYRHFDRYNVDVVSLALLADDTATHRPSTYTRNRWGCETKFRFPAEKLLDWHKRWADLETSPNPFSVVIMAHLQAQASKDGATRKGWKMRLMRLLYQRGYGREDILELFRVLDWMLRLPPALEDAFIQELTDFEEQAKMPYVTSAERVGHKRGLQEGRQEGRQEGEAAMLLSLIDAKFGPPSDAVRKRIEAADAETLLAWSKRILTADTIEDLWT
ncbi:MAG: hypothetical protein K9M02_19015 [Thiohalocapsa sp.]|nr:hypothetical protein [Thiohalocapsa sp.]